VQARQREAGLVMVERGLYPVVGGVAHGTIGGVTLLLVVGRNVILSGVATETLGACTGDVPLVAFRTLGYRAVTTR
jgi:hypothetical protein